MNYSLYYITIIIIITIYCYVLYSCWQDLPPTPWVSILTSWPVWALIIVEAGHDWGGYTIVSDLPKYMSDVLHFSVTEVSFKKQIIYRYFFQEFWIFIPPFCISIYPSIYLSSLFVIIVKRDLLIWNSIVTYHIIDYSQ